MFDLQNDVREKTNLADAHPEIVNRLTKMMEEFDQQLKKAKLPAGIVEIQ